MSEGLFQLNRQNITWLPATTIEQDFKAMKNVAREKALQRISRIDWYDEQWEAFVLLRDGAEVDIVTGRAV
jgi:hypothetical protein